MAATARGTALEGVVGTHRRLGEGGPGRPNMSAGIGLRVLLRLGMTWTGSFAFQLTYEVGDPLIAPIHQVLR